MPLNTDFVENPEPRCPVVLLLDTSGSMVNNNAIEQLNKGIQSFKQAIAQDPVASLRVESAIITFNSSVKIVQNFVIMDEFNPPLFTAEGTTSMGQAIEQGLDLVESRKNEYKNNGIDFYRPWVFLITDGEPTDNWQLAATRVRKSQSDRKILFFADF